ncbi:hypothetical protein K9M74_01450 [Candidatus Woesearchaeota archaeon]|nr:hypothetical protein [Candidatus Woesearchaeota archaeon]
MTLKLFSNGEQVQELQNQIKDAQRDVKHVSRHIAEQKEDVDKLIKQVKQIGNLQTEMLAKMQEATEHLVIASKDFEKAATNISLIRPALEKKMIENFSSAIEQELANTTNKIHAQAAGFNAAKDVFKNHAKTSSDALKDINKLHDAIKNIKAADFELEMHAKRLETNDQEKLRLMAKIDQLERMLAKMKRK